jgi:hypothetical protein
MPFVHCGLAVGFVSKFCGSMISRAINDDNRVGC